MNKNDCLPFVVHYLRRYTQKGHVLLDVGCGTAQYRNVTEGKYVGMDVTDEEYAQGLSRDVDIVASAVDIPMEGASCDMVFCVGAFYQIPEYDRAINEFHRVLRVGGRLILFDYNKRTQKQLALSEGNALPCWTQWGLKRIVQQAGFQECELLLATEQEVHGISKLLQLIRQELRGQWAIVTGIK